ncbi:MAG: polysaccharide deacetylase family protein [Chloroflexi bacterium]|nr:polysaccharide deacetylase family protein [Chloroflexota bacterium]
MNVSKRGTSATKDCTVPVLITWDVDPDLWRTFEKRQWAINIAMDMCCDLGIPATFFFTAEPAYMYHKDVWKMLAQGHEIGCHGLTHGNEEDYDRMPEDMQRAYIEEATEKLQALVGVPIHAFRSPRVKTSAVTLSLLAEYGYTADSSVCSQRIDFLSSNLINTGWIRSPRRPYHPNKNSPFKKGDVPIWEIPISAMIIPFISSALRVLGLPAMQALFKCLYAESRRTGKPIVYLMHPTEFTSSGQGKKRANRFKKYIRREYFSPSFIRTHGFRMRNLLYRMNAETLLNNTRDLFVYMASFSDVEFMTISEYVCFLDEPYVSLSRRGVQ